MPNYAYTVLNKNGEKLTGAIEAGDLGKARETLNKLGFSVVSIEDAGEAQKDNKTVKTFEFEGLDETGKKVEGTIKSKDEVSAYRRLKKEYNLEVKYIIDESLDPAQKEIKKNKGTADLEIETKREEEKIKKDDGSGKMMKYQLEQEQALKRKVEFVIKKIDEFMVEYKGTLEPSKLEEIRKEKDKLLRIKGSKNLDYIKGTTEDLLKILQEEELFLKGKISEERKAHLKIEAKRIIDDINSKELSPIQANRLTEKIKNWQKEQIGDHEDLKFYERFIQKILSWILKLVEEDPTVTILKQKISTLNHQIIKYIKLYIKEESKDGKTDIKHSLKLIFAERKKIKAELSGLKAKLRFQQKTDPKGQTFEGKSTTESIRDTITSFSGWLLAFYLIYYFVSIYITTKDFGLGEISRSFYIYNSSTFKYIIIIIFLLHTSYSLKRNILPRSTAASIVIYPLFTIIGFLILFNL